jgi:TolB-like protein/tetratricopeptide (TPR) repeat protein
VPAIETAPGTAYTPSGMSNPRQAVFLSYASQDTDAARRIHDALRAAGIEVWFDQSELRSGDAWDTAIRRQVQECALFIAVISANTNARSEGYFRREWNLAVRRMLDMADDQPFLLPVLIDDTAEPAARVPDRFRERQWARLPGGEVAAGFVERVARLLAGGRVITDPAPAQAHPSVAVAGTTRGDDGFWVAVLPFAHGGTDPGVAALAEGLSEGIVTGMSRFSYLRVVARGATLRYASTAADTRSVSRELGARYVMEGSVRHAGNKVRIAVQLVDGNSGATLWAEAYDRPYDPAAVFDLQDELVPRIVATVADMHGILPRSMSAALRSRDPAQLSPYEAVLRSFTYSERVTADELVIARQGVEVAVRNAPDYADAWAMLAWLCLQDHAQGFGIQADSLAKGLAAARRAVEAAPSNHLAHFGLAQAFYFSKDIESFRNAAERAVALNPMDGYSIAFLGELLTYSGDWKRGLELAGRAKQLNPHHPGWYWYADVYRAYSQGDFRGAIGSVLRANMPGHWGFHAMLAAAYGQLGELDAAGKALNELLRLRPNFAALVRGEFEKWCWTTEYAELFVDGLRKAGLEVPPGTPAVSV